MAHSETYQCTTLDNLWPVVVQQWVLGFPCADSERENISAILHTGLARTFRQQPYLGGRLVADGKNVGCEEGRLAVVYTGGGDDKVYEDIARQALTVQDVNTRPGLGSQTYGHVRSLRVPREFLTLERFGPPGDVHTLESSVIAACVSFIAGGCVLFVCVNHSVMDGVGAATVVGQWARNCFDIQQLGGLKEGVKTGISDVVPSSKPSSRPSASPSKTTRLPLAFAEGEFAVSGQELDRLQKQVQLWKALGLRKPAEARVSLPTSLSKTPASSISSAPILPDLISTVFAASKAAVAHLKAVSTPIHANESPSTSQKSLNTTFDSIAALLWRSIIRARLPDLDKPDDPTAICRLRIPVSVRQALDLPREHTGNAFLHSVTELPLGALLAPGDFGRTACPLIRSSILAVRTPDVARAAVALSSAVPRLLGPDRRQHALFAEGPEGGPPSGRDLVLSSWRDLEWYRHDWGAMFAMPEGRPEFVRMPVGAYHAGLCAILPRRIQRGEEGGSEVEDVEEVVISLTKQQMGRLEQDSEFGKYFQSVVSSKV